MGIAHLGCKLAVKTFNILSEARDAFRVLLQETQGAVASPTQQRAELSCGVVVIHMQSGSVFTAGIGASWVLPNLDELILRYAVFPHHSPVCDADLVHCLGLSASRDWASKLPLNILPMNPQRSQVLTPPKLFVMSLAMPRLRRGLAAVRESTRGVGFYIDLDNGLPLLCAKAVVVAKPLGNGAAFTPRFQTLRSSSSGVVVRENVVLGVLSPIPQLIMGVTQRPLFAGIRLQITMADSTLLVGMIVPRHGGVTAEVLLIMSGAST